MRGTFILARNCDMKDDMPMSLFLSPFASLFLLGRQPVAGASASTGELHQTLHAKRFQIALHGALRQLSMNSDLVTPRNCRCG